MKRLTNLKKILIIDFGSQFTQLIARRIRELGVFSEIVSHKNLKKINVNDLFGIILSGGPLNVYQDKKIKLSNKIFYLECPILGICFGHQMISKFYVGKVKSSKIHDFQGIGTDRNGPGGGNGPPAPANPRWVCPEKILDF